MDREQIIAAIEELGVVPVVRAASADEAMRAIDAIKEGGINVLEITMTVSGAIKVIEEVVKRYGDEALVGAGTVLDPETARACLLAGAQFIVSQSGTQSRHDRNVPPLQRTGHARRADADRGHHGVECRGGFRQGLSLRIGRRRKLCKKS